MIKVSVFYPDREGSKFDMDYYCNSHIPMVREKLGPACKNVAVEQGIGCYSRVAAWIYCDGTPLFRFGRGISKSVRPTRRCNYGGHSELH